MQALTKYPSGGGDVLMGSVTTRDDALHQRLKATHMRMGFGVGANDVELVLRSLPSLDAALRGAGPRRRAQLARVVGERGPRSSQVLHPALAGSPGHEHWARAVQRRPPGCSRSSSTRASARAQVDAFVDALKLFRIGYSWAGPVSLACPTTWRRCARSRRWRRARWCASRSASRRSRT